MSSRSRLVVVSGIPGCGKSTLARQLAELLAFSYLDKDDFFDLLLHDSPVVDEETRHRLSRQADRDFERAARCQPEAVLDSFWRHPSAHTRSGTPSDWLMAPEFMTAEVFCSCPPEIAATRFLARTRHPGHLDSAWDTASLVDQSRRLLSDLPLGIGPMIEVDTTAEIDVPRIARRIRVLLQI